MLKATIENKSAVTIHGLKPGARTEIETDENGTPLNKHWRRRVADSTIDGAVEVVKTARNGGTPRNKEPKKREVKK